MLRLVKKKAPKNYQKALYSKPNQVFFVYLVPSYTLLLSDLLQALVFAVMVTLRLSTQGTINEGISQSINNCLNDLTI